MQRCGDKAGNVANAGVGRLTQKIHEARLMLGRHGENIDDRRRPITFLDREHMVDRALGRIEVGWRAEAAAASWQYGIFRNFGKRWSCERRHFSRQLGLFRCEW
jgi:hypothetical protein